mgnify:CR=1 FL=1
MTNQSIEVNWGTLGVLQVERLCQSVLLKKSTKWHYHMTIAVSFLFPIHFIFDTFYLILNRVANCRFKQILIEYRS